MKKWIYRILFFLCTAVLILSGTMLIRHFYEQFQSQSNFQKLAETVDNRIGEEKTESTDPERTESTGEGELRLQAYRELHSQNADLVGWIRIDDTRINYPVMQTPDDPEFYLRRSFEKTESPHGVPFADYRDDLAAPSDNIILYGHHMKDGSMFADLMRYTDFSFFEEHPIIHFDTLGALGDYQIVAVFKTPAEGEASFAYNNFIDFDTEESFDEFFAEANSRRLYDTGVTASFGDKLLTLSTCEYTVSPDGRLAVVAKAM